MAADDNGIVYVALHEHNEAVALPRNALPQDPDDVLNLLSSEAAPLQCWIDTAKAYLSQGFAEGFLSIIEEANSHETLEGIKNYFGKEPTFERVQMFCAMAAYHLEAARVEKDPHKRTEAVEKAEAHVRSAEQLGPREMLPHMAKAMLAQARNDQQGALLEYRRAAMLTHNGRQNHAPLLGQAALHYSSGSLAEAVKLYSQVLRGNPQCPAEVRLGIAACYYRAGKVEAAEAAYNRVLELEPGCADALLGLAVIKFGSKDAQEGLNSGLQLLQRAFAADPTHPGMLCALSHFSLLKGDAQQALELAQAAADGADTDRLKAVSLSLLGRCHHALGDLAQAQHHYAQAIRLDPKAPLPHLGTAQVYLATGSDPNNAVSELELVLKTLPGNVDAMRLLGGLLPVLQDRVAKALTAHREAAARQVHDGQLQEILGELLAPTEPAAALAAFEQALSLHRQHQAAVQSRNSIKQAQRQKLLDEGGDVMVAELMQEIGQDEEIPQVPAKLLNNTAVLKYRAGSLSEALDLMSQATAVMMTDTTTTPMQKVTMGYNMARLQEAAGDLKAASAGYQALLQTFPGYIDCYVRLSAMAKAAGDVDAARHWATEATKQAGGHVDAQALLASLHLERGDLQAARQCVGSVNADGATDPYMLLTHANVVLAALPTDRAARITHADHVRNRDYIMKALQMYQTVLKTQADNVYAVNGLGVCLAELGNTAAAKAAIDEVLRATSRTKGFMKVPEAYVNLGNLWLGRQRYNDALKMYEHASKLNSHKDAQILLYMARTHHDAGNHLAAKHCLLKALHLAPTNVKMRFNLAFVLQEWSVKVFRKKYAQGDPNKCKEYEAATTGLREAERIFRHLYQLGRDSTRIEPKKLQMHANFCAGQLPNALKLLSEARTEQRHAEAQRQLRQAQLMAAEAERRHREVMESAAKKAEQTRKVAEAQRVLEESRAKLEALRATRAMPHADEADGATAGSKTAGGKRKRKKGAAGEDMSDFYVDDAQPIERLPKKGKSNADVKAALKRTGLDSDEDDENSNEADVEQLFGSGNGSDDEQQQQQRDGNADVEAGDLFGVSEGNKADRQAAAAAAAGGGGSGSRGRLRRQAPAAAAGGDGSLGDGLGDGLEGQGEVDDGTGAGGFEVDDLFVDEPRADEAEPGAAAAVGGTRRQRQALESDDEDYAPADITAAEAAADDTAPEDGQDDGYGGADGGADGDAAAEQGGGDDAMDEDGLEDLF